MKPERMSTIEACIDDIRSAYEDLEMVKDEEGISTLGDAIDNLEIRWFFLTFPVNHLLEDFNKVSHT